MPTTPNPARTPAPVGAINATVQRPRCVQARCVSADAERAAVTGLIGLETAARCVEAGKRRDRRARAWGKLGLAFDVMDHAFALASLAWGEEVFSAGIGVVAGFKFEA